MPPPLIASTTSRLLVDLNRSIGNPVLHAAQIRRLSTKQRGDILARHYRPFRNLAEQAVRRVIAENGKVRRADIGLLYAPVALANACCAGAGRPPWPVPPPQLIVRRIYPYAGKGDGLTRWLRQRLPADVYVGIELEVNQRHVFQTGPHWPALRQILIATLRYALGGAPAGHAAPFPTPSHPRRPSESTLRRLS